ncbi:MAG TPA: hypothetical protein VF916_14100 [Ktedonobacterales bacterium]
MVRGTVERWGGGFPWQVVELQDEHAAPGSNRAHVKRFDTRADAVKAYWANYAAYADA